MALPYHVENIDESEYGLDIAAAQHSNPVKRIIESNTFEYRYPCMLIEVEFQC